jgi:hypothetical protein
MSKAYELATVLGGGTLVTDTDLSTAIAGVGGGITSVNEYFLTSGETSGTSTAYIEGAVTRTSSSYGTALTVNIEQETNGRWGRTFQFTETGVYLIQFNISGYSSSADSRQAIIHHSTDSGSNYGTIALGYSDGTNTWTNNNMSVVLDVTNISTSRIRFGMQNVSSAVTVEGNGGISQTSMTFIRLGDTTG